VCVYVHVLSVGRSLFFTSRQIAQRKPFKTKDWKVNGKRRKSPSIGSPAGLFNLMRESPIAFFFPTQDVCVLVVGVNVLYCAHLREATPRSRACTDMSFPKSKPPICDS